MPTTNTPNQQAYQTFEAAKKVAARRGIFSAAQNRPPKSWFPSSGHVESSGVVHRDSPVSAQPMKRRRTLAHEKVRQAEEEGTPVTVRRRPAEFFAEEREKAVRRKPTTPQSVQPSASVVSSSGPSSTPPTPVPIPATVSHIPSTKAQEISDETISSGEELYTHWTRNMAGMLGDEEFTDCVIEVGEEKVKAHKCVLSRHSSVLREQFTSAKQQSKDGKESLCVVKADGYSPKAVRVMLEYLYTGHVDAEEMGKMGAELLRLSFDYQLIGLKHFAAHHLSSTVSVENALDLAKVADTHSVPELFKACCRVLLSNCDGILDGDEWKTLVTKDGSLAAKLLTLGLLDKKKGSNGSSFD